MVYGRQSLNMKKIIKLTSTEQNRVEENLLLAYAAVWKLDARYRILKNGIEISEAMQWASLALCHAAQHYDPDRNVKFTTYATATVLNNVRKEAFQEISLMKLHLDDESYIADENYMVETSIDCELESAIKQLAIEFNRIFNLDFDCEKILYLWAEYGTELAPPRVISKITDIPVKEIYKLRARLKKFITKKDNRQLILSTLGVA